MVKKNFNFFKKTYWQCTKSAI